MKSQKSKVKSQKRYLPYIFLALILLIGAAFRFYRISEYLTFLGDEGRDVLVVKRIIKDGKLTLLGPITSVGSMYMGPIYYYFMIPFLWLWQFDPTGPAVMVALFSLATIFLLYLASAEFFSIFVGLVASLLYAISPLPIIYGRSSWNPNIVPFFSLLLIYALLKVIVKKEYNFFIIVGFSLGILIQLHYATLFFIPIILSSLFLIRFRIPLYNLLLAVGAFITSYSPFILFELRHQFVNSQGVLRFILQQKSSTSHGIVSFWETLSDVFVRVFWRLIVIENAEVTKIFILVSLILLALYFKNLQKDLPKRRSLYVIGLWLLISLLSFGLYQGVVYDYYFGSLFTLPFILTGIVISYPWQKYKIKGKAIALILISTLVFFNLKNSPLKIPPSNLLANTEAIARFVFEKTKGQPYNFALIAGKNSDHAYRYFLELWEHPPSVIEPPDIDPQKETVAGQLFVVCEEKVCQPLGHPLWEIAGFGRAEIVGEWNVVTAKVFKLVPYEGE